jgi:hypothetical protein
VVNPCSEAPFCDNRLDEMPFIKWGRRQGVYFLSTIGKSMNRLLSVLAFCTALFVVEAVRAQCCGAAVTTAYYAPAPVTTYYAPVRTAYYAPAPATVYYAAPAPVYYQRPLVGVGITRVGYAPVTYVTPRAAYYAPATYTVGYAPWW